VNIVVPMKQIPDLQQLRIRNRKPVFDDVPLTFGKIDKNALEAAVQLKEIHGGEVIAVSVGNEDVEETIKEAAAAGADRSYLVAEDDALNLESSDAAQVLAAVIKKIDDVGLIIFSEGSGDNYSGQVGSRVAAILDLPQVGSVTEITINGSAVQVVKSLEDRIEVLEVQMPAVIVIAGDMNEPRLPSVTQVLKAGKKPKEIIELDDLDIKIKGNTIETLSNLAPEMNRKRIKVKTISEIIEVIKTEGLMGR
jgi:electron transfer flavoprotein beta subunit